MPRLIGYARASARDPDDALESQISELNAAGCVETYREQTTSSAPKRSQLTACLAVLRRGDVLVVNSPDRLAKDPAALLTIEADLASRGVGLLVLDTVGGKPLDTRKPSAAGVLDVLACVAAWDRIIRRERLREGVAAGVAAGKFKGKPRSIDPAKIKALAASGQSAVEIAREMGIHRSHVYKLLKL